MIDVIKDLLISGGLIAVLSILSGLLSTWIKKGQFENWGKITGRYISKLGNTKLGKEKWERIEDVITLAILSFAKGLKIGADSDDGKLKRIETHLQKGLKIGDKIE